MSETGTETATVARTGALDRRSLWGGGVVIIAVIAAAFGWRSNLIPPPLLEVLGHASPPFLLDGAVTAVIEGTPPIGGVVAVGMSVALHSPSPRSPLHVAARLFIGSLPP